MSVKQILLVSRIFLFVSGYLAYPVLASLSSGNNFTFRSESKHRRGAEQGDNCRPHPAKPNRLLLFPSHGGYITRSTH